MDIATFVYMNGKQLRNLHQSFTGLSTDDRDNLLLQIEEQLFEHMQHDDDVNNRAQQE